MANRALLAKLFVLVLLSSHLCWGFGGGCVSGSLSVYERVVFEEVGAYLYTSGYWDCSNLSWSVMKSFQAEGFDAWYCAGFVRNQTDEAHAWVVIRGNNTFTRINPSEWYLEVVIPDEVYLRDYRMVRCSNETYFDWVPVDPEREYW